MEKYVLVVEDNPSDQLIASTHVELEGYIPVVAKNGYEAIDMFDEFDFCLFLVDLHMPQMGGIEFIRRLKRIENYKSVPVMVFSARKDASDVRMALQTGANEYLLKPLDSMVFQEKFRRIVGATEAWKEYDVDSESDMSLAFIQVPVQLTTINEIGIKFLSENPWEEGRVLEMKGNFLGDQGLAISGVVKECKPVKDKYQIRVVFVGASEATRKNIRFLCREIFRFNQQQKKIDD